MTLNEALEKLQNPRPGFANRLSVRYAQSHLAQICEEYGIDTSCIIYGIDDK